jgi:hypothetical protein
MVWDTVARPAYFDELPWRRYGRSRSRIALATATEQAIVFFWGRSDSELLVAPIDRPTTAATPPDGLRSYPSIFTCHQSYVRCVPLPKEEKKLSCCFLALRATFSDRMRGCGVNMAPKTPPAKPSLHALARRARSDRHDKVRARRYQLDKESRYTDTASRRPNGTAPTGWMLIGCFLFFLSKKKTTTHQFLPCWFFFLFLFNFFNTK